MQKLLRTGNHPRSRRRDFLFRGLLKCEHCGCAIVGEIKKGRYVYYHCTQARGRCDQPWVREEVLDSQMVSIFKAIELNEDTVHAILKALKDNQQKEKTFRESEVKRLKRKHAELQARIDRAYEDRLDGIIDSRYWGEISGKWRDEQSHVAARIDQFSSSNQNYMEQALEILELSKLAYSLYLEREVTEKRRLLNSVLSNCTYDGLTLYPTYKKPFDLIAEGVQNHIKHPRLDSNQLPSA
ncbi:zinc ribbon domain-containing protein [Candidatus Zixiibacteriota bacterium]